MVKQITLRVLPSRVVITYVDDGTAAKFFIAGDLEKFCHKNLRMYILNRRTKRYEPGAKYYVDDVLHNKWIIPRPFLNKLKEFLNTATDNTYNITIEDGETGLPVPRNIGLTISDKYQDREGQAAAIDFLVANQHNRSGLELQTGCIGSTGHVFLERNGVDESCTLSKAHQKWLSWEPWKDGADKVYTKSFDGVKLIKNQVLEVINTGIKHTHRIRLDNKQFVDATHNHKIQTRDGMLAVSTMAMLPDVKVANIPYRPVGIAPRPQPSDEVQWNNIVSISEPSQKRTFDLSCNQPHNNFLVNGVVVHNSGKTYCSLRAATTIGHVTMIVVEGLVDQWFREICKITKARKDEVYVIQGFKSLFKLLESKRRPKVFIFSLGTLRKYVKYEGNYRDIITYGEFTKRYGIGTKIVDESHRALHAVSLIDMAADIKTNIYMTATFITADKMLRRIFHTYFPNQMRYDEVYDRYVDIYGYKYDSNIRTTSTIAYGTYSHAKLEKLRLRHMRNLMLPFIDHVLCPIIYKHFVGKPYKKKKLLIYFTLRDTITEVAAILSERYPQFKVVTYLAEDNDDVFTYGDIILSTHKGAGTGTDIKDLVTVIDTVSYMAETTARQNLGRLRKDADRELTFISIHDPFNTVQVRHWEARKTYFKACAKELHETEL